MVTALLINRFLFDEKRKQVESSKLLTLPGSGFVIIAGRQCGRLRKRMTLMNGGPLSMHAATTD